MLANGRFLWRAVGKPAITLKAGHSVLDLHFPPPAFILPPSTSCLKRSCERKLKGGAPETLSVMATAACWQPDADVESLMNMMKQRYGEHVTHAQIAADMVTTSKMITQSHPSHPTAERDILVATKHLGLVRSDTLHQHLTNMRITMTEAEGRDAVAAKEDLAHRELQSLFADWQQCVRHYQRQQPCTPQQISALIKVAETLQRQSNVIL